jgi:lysophospholipase L1-like esterase
VRILILGDSLPAPRPKKGQPLEKTWPGLLKHALPAADIWQRARPRAGSLDVLAEFKLFTESLDRFDAIVVQTGIVDCVPRPYPLWFLKVIEVFATFEQLRALDRIAHKYCLWLYNRPWASKPRFRENVERLVRESLALNPALKIALVGIAPPTRRILERFQALQASVVAYNAILADLSTQYGSRVTYVNPFEKQDPLEITIDDGHHLSTCGHELVANALFEMLVPHSTPSLIPPPSEQSLS